MIGLIIGLVLLGMAVFSYCSRRTILFYITTPLFIASFLFFHLFPYTQQLNDRGLILALESDVITYQSYINDYTEEDRQVLQEWAKQQEDMARKLSSLGMQFAGDIQPNEIIKKLSGKIEELQNLALQKRIDINHVKGRMKARADNRWYFRIPSK